MKKILVVALVVAIALVGATAAMATVFGSKHDFSSAGSTTNGYSGTQTMSSCQYCHTPHHANGTAAPLWNRSTRDIATYPFLSYASVTAGGPAQTLAGSSVGQPGVNSLTCLSCHDGTIGIGSVLHGNADNIIKGGVLLGGKMDPAAAGYINDLRTTHPIGVVYDSTKVKAGLTGGVSNNITGGWKIYGGSGDGSSTVECGSCHDPHNTTAGQAPFLKGNKSSICTDCHGQK